MLLLTRRVNETFSIDGQIYLKVIGIKGSQVCIGVHAPKEIKILRTELLSTHQQNHIKERLNGEVGRDTLCGENNGIY